MGRDWVTYPSNETKASLPYDPKSGWANKLNWIARRLPAVKPTYLLYVCSRYIAQCSEVADDIY